MGALTAKAVGFFIHAHRQTQKAKVDAMRATAQELDAMVATWASSEDELMQQYKKIRRASREKKPNAK